MKKRMILIGSIRAGIVLILSMMTTVVSAQTIKSNEIKTNIVQQLKETMKDNDRKPGDILNITLLKDVIKDSGWFPGLFLLTFFIILISGIVFSYIGFILL